MLIEVRLDDLGLFFFLDRVGVDAFEHAIGLRSKSSRNTLPPFVGSCSRDQTRRGTHLISVDVPEK